MDMLRGYHNMMSNLSQITLLVILFPFVTVLYCAIMGADASTSLANVLVSLVGEIPLCEVWIDILFQTSSVLSQSWSVSSPHFFGALPSAFLRSVPEALLLAFSVHLSNQIFRALWKARGLPILSYLLGGLISSIMKSLTGLIMNLSLELGADFIIVAGIVLASRVVFRKRGLTIFSPHRVFCLLLTRFWL